MAIEGYNEDDVGNKLGEVLSASRPIHSIEYLKGRDKELDTIKKSLYAPGRHVFIFGDRGVGKSSLGQTAAYQYQSADASPIFVSGSPNDTFNTVIANIVSQAIRRPRTENIKSSKTLAVEVGGIKISEGQDRSGIDIAAAIRSVGDAVEILKQIATQHSEKPVVVIDEFDAILDPVERNMFAALLKQMGDQSVNLKFIFTGIGKSLDELLGAHQSAYRQLETVELPRLGWEARREIVKDAVQAFGLELNDDVNWRVAMISDGFPYYIHLITEKVLWAAFSAEETVTAISWDLFNHGLADAIFSTTAELKRPYEKAVLQHEPEFEDIVWATADHDDSQRSLKAMYVSYQIIVGKRGDGREAIDQPRFSAQIRKLKSAGYGAVLLQEEGRPGWYTYREKMLRGYVRMQAQANGIELTGERPTPKQAMHIGNARSGYHGSSIPAGVRQKQNVSEWDLD
jgi:archaellum biogenesis ATPase FlaH